MDIWVYIQIYLDIWILDVWIYFDTYRYIVIGIFGYIEIFRIWIYDVG